jgi:23S rRNA pseudouridine1911/1915/1917 synthase
MQNDSNLPNLKASNAVSTDNVWPNPSAKPRFHILYELGPTIVINKQPGVLTQARMGVDSLEARVKEFMNQRENRSGKRYLGLPHRLDRPASGVLVFTKHVRAARKLSEQFEERSVSKKYWALVSGTVTEDEGAWHDYMRKIPGCAEAELIPPIHPDAREAVLRFRTLERFKNVTWLEIQLETGRTHQIRLQCSSRGFPLLGDELYGSTVPFGRQFEDERERAIALHARELTFIDFTTKEKTTVCAPLYAPWSQWIHPQDDGFIEEFFLRPEPFTTDIYGIEGKSASSNDDHNG